MSPHLRIHVAALIAMLFFLEAPVWADDVSPPIDCWVSSADLTKTLSRVEPADMVFRRAKRASKSEVRVDDTTQYQSVLGMGSSFEHTTCENLMRMPPDERQMAVN